MPPEVWWRNSGGLGGPNAVRASRFAGSRSLVDCQQHSAIRVQTGRCRAVISLFESVWELSTKRRHGLFPSSIHSWCGIPHQAHRECSSAESRANLAAGALLAANFEGFLKGVRAFDVLFEPTERKSLDSFAPTRGHVLLNELDNVRSRLYVLTHKDGTWKREELPGLPKFGNATATAVDGSGGTRRGLGASPNAR